MCSGCYTAEIPGTDPDLQDVYPQYKAWKKKMATFSPDSVPEGEDVAAAAEAWKNQLLANNRGWTSLGWEDYFFTHAFKDTTDFEVIDYPSDQTPHPVAEDTEGQTPPGRFISTCGTPTKKPIPGTGSDPVPENPCGCYSRQPPTAPAPEPAEGTLLLWEAANSPNNDPGSGSPSGPSSGGGGSGGELASVPMEMNFGMGRAADGSNPAIFSFSTELDSADPFAANKFKLRQPFAVPGQEPVTVTENPEAGVTRRMSGLGTTVDESREGDGSKIKFKFKKTDTGQIDAIHELERIPETGANDPGIRHTVTRDSVIEVTELYGKTTSGGGRTWKEKAKGKITEGVSTPYDAEMLRSELVRHKKFVGGAEILLDERSEKFKKFSFGERLIESATLGADGQMATTTYAYYDSGLLKWTIQPDGSWVRKEYNSDGTLLRELRPWLNGVTSPQDATLSNSAATTYVGNTRKDEHWEIESVQGVVTNRSWTRRQWDQLDPLILATDYAWKTPMWWVQLPASVHTGDYSKAGKKLGLSRSSPAGSPIIEIGSGAISTAFRALIGQEVDFNSEGPYWGLRSKRPPPFKLHEKHVQEGTYASITVQCHAAITPSVGITFQVNTTQSIGPFMSSGAGTAQEVAQGLYDYLVLNAGPYLNFNLDLANATVTVSSLEQNSQQSLQVSAANALFTPSALTAVGTDSVVTWPVLSTYVWKTDLQNWEAPLSQALANQVPSSRQLALARYDMQGTRFPVAEHSGRLDLTLAALTGASATYTATPRKFSQSAYVKPPAFVVLENILDPGTPGQPAVDPVPATLPMLTVSCNQPLDGDVIVITKTDNTGVISTETYTVNLSTVPDAEALAAALGGAPGSTSFTLTGNAVGSTAVVSISSTNGSVAAGAIYGMDEQPGIDAIPPVLPFYTWTIIGICDWTLIPVVTTPQGPGPLGDLNLFNGSFNTTMTQRFTADYNQWDGRLELRDAGSVEGVSGQLRRVVDHTGRVTMFNYDRGAYDGVNKTFNWTQTGQAVKQTQRTYAADPATFQLLAADPVSRVTMSDYQGQTRVEQTWKDTNKVVESTHDYDAATRDRLWTKEDAVKTYEAVRDTTANHLTVADATGTQTRTQFTPDGEVAHTAKLGHGGRADIVSSLAEDGLTTISTTTAGNLKRTSSSTRGPDGRTVSSTDENGFTTNYAYELGGRRTIETRPDGSTRITESYLDGRIKSVTGTGVLAEYHTYSVDAEGSLTETVYFNDDGTGGTRSPRWRSTTTNGLGWVIAEAQPAPSGAAGAPRGTLASQHHYNTKGQRVRTQRPGQRDLLITYDSFGRQASQGIDMNSNGTLELTGVNAEPVTSTVSSFEQISGNWFEKSVTTETAQGGSGAGSRTTTSLRLLGGALYDVDMQYTSDGLATTSVTNRNPAGKTVSITVTTNRAAETLTATRSYVNGLLVSETVPGATGSSEYDYDALERPTVVKDLAGMRRRMVYADVAGGAPPTPALARSLVAEEQVKAAGAADYSTERGYAYHSSAGQPGFGRVSTVTQADSTTLSYAYDLHGHQTFVGGTATYPVRYQYDDFGELWKMHTFRSGTPTATSTGDVTTWTRDDATGILLSKTDAAAKGVTTTYDPASGRVWKRTLARKTPTGADITITYDYDDAGRLKHIDYSDATPDVIHTYYTDGRLKTTLDAAGLHTYDYSGPNGALKGETITGAGLLAGSSWSTTFDDANRVNVYTWNWTGAGSRSIDYDYDSAGRLWKVHAFGHSATYGYHAATGRKETLTYSGAGLTGTWTHDARGRLDAIDWKVGANVLSRHDYGFDALHRRTSAERENGETWRYDYNDRGEVESAVKKADNTAGAAAKRGLQSGYGYDLIGNRIMDKQHTPTSGNGLSEAVWTANALNQITEGENHDSRWVFGHVKQEASLTVTGNSGEVIRDGDEFAIPLSRTGAGNAADWHSLDVTATLAGVGRVVDGTALDVTTQRHGKVWFPTSPEDLQYDDDGNLTQDGRWNFTWNAENRLICAETRADVATATGMPRMRLDMAYDAMGRRIRKVVQSFSSTEQAWQTQSDLRFLYEGMSWNLVAELNLKPETSNLELVRSYAWGTDISGTMDGAGGVGGLLFVQQLSTTVNNSPTSSTISAPCYDGNGNISAYVSVQSGTVSSRHDYDAFGRPVWNELEGTGGKQAAVSPFGFSTKYLDGETGLLSYGFRYYSPGLGRWPSRDPIEEQGGINLYGMVGNDPVNFIDIAGLTGWGPMSNVPPGHNPMTGAPMNQPGIGGDPHVVILAAIFRVQGDALGADGLLRYNKNKGKWTLTKVEVASIDFANEVNVFQHNNVMQAIMRIIAGEKKPIKVKSDGAAYGTGVGNGNNLLGNFTIEMSATVNCDVSGYKVDGTFKIKDHYNFDPKWADYFNGQNNRSFIGQVRTAVGALFIPGTPYDIDSVDIPFTQTANEQVAKWKD